MFERYTERARRVLFFARYEASQLGSISIETEHLLLGLIREGKGLTSRIFARSHLSLESIRKEIEGRTVFREKVSTSVEIPFSAETKRVPSSPPKRRPSPAQLLGTSTAARYPLRSARAATILMEKGMPSTPSARKCGVLNANTTLTRVRKPAPRESAVTHRAAMKTARPLSGGTSRLNAARFSAAARRNAVRTRPASAAASRAWREDCVRRRAAFPADKRLLARNFPDRSGPKYLSVRGTPEAI